MSDPTFVKTRYEYGSYVDYWRLVELSGYSTCYVDEMDVYDSTKCYIIGMLNGEWKDGWPDAKARIILSDLEWHLDNPPDVRGVSEVWAADAWYARQIGARYVPLGSHKGLMMTGQSEPRVFLYDVATMMYTYGRRENMVNQLAEANVKMAPKAWDVSRDLLLRQSKFMLQIHQLEAAPTIAPQRFALAAAYGMPMISESVADPGIFVATNIQFSGFNDLCATVRRELDDADPVRYRDNAMSLHQLLCEDYTFRKCVETAL